MTIHDISITEMQQHDIEANTGNTTYTIRVHSLKSETEDDEINDDLICL